MAVDPDGLPPPMGHAAGRLPSSVRAEASHSVQAAADPSRGVIVFFFPVRHPPIHEVVAHRVSCSLLCCLSLPDRNSICVKMDGLD